MTDRVYSDRRSRWIPRRSARFSYAALVAFILPCLMSITAEAASSKGEDPGEDADAEAHEEALPEAPLSEEEQKDITSFTAAAGGQWSTGNSRTLAGTGSVDFVMRRSVHEFTAAAMGNIGATAPEGPVTDESEDLPPHVLNARKLAFGLRYDWHFHNRWSALIMVDGLNDKFQAVDFRLNVIPGVAFHLLNAENHKLWFGLGYDFEFEVRNEEALAEARMLAAANMDSAEVTGDLTTRTLPPYHSARLYVSYLNNLNKALTFTAKFGYLHNLHGNFGFRLHGETGLATQISTHFSMAVNFMIHYDSKPTYTVAPLDTLTTFQLVFKI